MLAIEGDYIAGFDIYKHKDALKMLHCKWNPDAKKWVVPDNPDRLKLYINKVNETEKEMMKAHWEQALENCGYERAKKGTKEYDEVKAEMKKLMLNEKSEQLNLNV